MSFAEPIRVISDLHLGHVACGLPDVRLIEPLLAGAGTVIFNGDTAELRSPLFRPRARLEQDKLTAMLAKLGITPIYLTGNHDPDVTDQHCLELLGGRVVIAHGDFLFRYISPWSHTLPLNRPRIEEIWREVDPERFARDFGYCLEITRRSCEVLEHRLIRKPAHRLGRLLYLAREFWPPQRVWTILKVWLTTPRRMIAAMSVYRPEAQILIYGHIHQPSVLRRAGRVAINTGGFMRPVRASVVEISGQRIRARPVQGPLDDLRLGAGEAIAWPLT